MAPLHFREVHQRLAPSGWPPEPSLGDLLDGLGPDEVFDMRVLEPDQTGVPFLVWISTRLGSHGPRVKGYLGRSERDQPSFSMSIGDDPEVVATSYSDRRTLEGAKALGPWIKLNAPALRDLWNNGSDWTDREVRAFVDALLKV